MNLDVLSVAPVNTFDILDPVTIVSLATAVSYVIIFFIVPRINRNFKESGSWISTYEFLVKNNLVSLTAKDAARAQQTGAVMLDVRPAEEFSGGFVEDSLSVPLYRPIQGWGAAANLRRAGFAFFGSTGSELNPDWLQQVQGQIKKGTHVVVMCSRGGSLASQSSTYGYESRSLKAAFLLMQAGYSNVLHLKGGIEQWERDDLPLLAYYEDDDDDDIDGGEPITGGEFGWFQNTIGSSA
eukprot:CAMPEP_0196583154 /NCGR_PEP_ID=MMETSP1081-20130531/42282_1 /TAXON_ID=36882 /ORGANISM="Pyramimonas amylifera, Strain CCMP720" /LENGTH=238 /DNA_ID=CAMNT_0041903951 /DNA_START=233 /DNA_END=949 /DNA_ORIENTATION=+